MGIAAVYSAGTKYKVFWALILAAPDDRPDNAEKSSVSGKSALAKGARR
jgi:hypothetical protein